MSRKSSRRARASCSGVRSGMRARPSSPAVPAKQPETPLFALGRGGGALGLALLRRRAGPDPLELALAPGGEGGVAQQDEVLPVAVAGVFRPVVAAEGHREAVVDRHLLVHDAAALAGAEDDALGPE